MSAIWIMSVASEVARRSGQGPGVGGTHVRNFVFVLVVEDLVQNLDIRFWLDRYPGFHPLRVNKAYQFFRSRPRSLLSRLIIALGFRVLGTLRACRRHGSFVVETVQITARFGKLPDPRLRLLVSLVSFSRLAASPTNDCRHGKSAHTSATII